MIYSRMQNWNLIFLHILKPIKLTLEPAKTTVVEGILLMVSIGQQQKAIVAQRGFTILRRDRRLFISKMVVNN